MTKLYLSFNHLNLITLLELLLRARSAAEVSGARATARDADGAGTPRPHGSAGGGRFVWVVGGEDGGGRARPISELRSEAGPWRFCVVECLSAG